MRRFLWNLRRQAWRFRVELSFVVFFIVLAAVINAALDNEPLRLVMRSHGGEDLIKVVQAQGGTIQNYNYGRGPFGAGNGRYAVTFDTPKFGDAELKKLVEGSGDVVSSLDFRGTSLTDAGLEPLSNLTMVDSLSISTKSNATSPGTSASSSNQLTGKALLPIARMRNLTTLNISGVPISDDDLQLLDGFRYLYTLSLEHTQIRGPGLMNLKSRFSLASLTLADAPFDDEGMKAFDRASSLQILTLARLKVTGAGLAHLSSVHSPQLSNLTLDGLDLKDEDLASLIRINGLRHLSLMNMKINGSGLTKLASLQKLVQVDLYGIEISDDTIIDLSEFLPNVTIHRFPSPNPSRP